VRVRSLSAPRKGSRTMAKMLSIVITTPITDDLRPKVSFRKTGTYAFHIDQMIETSRKPKPSRNVRGQERRSAGKGLRLRQWGPFTGAFSQGHATGSTRGCGFPEDLHRVEGSDAVGGHEREVFDNALGDEAPSNGSWWCKSSPATAEA
jgi:hypothetical protein